MNRMFSKYYNDQFPFWVFTASVFILAILPSLVQDGMFIDGTQYAVVSKNFANGLGTFWFPHISQNWSVMGSGYFLENPPLVYTIQGMFFKVLGDSMYTERIYCLFTALLAVFLIVRIWKHITRQSKDMQKLSWLPVLVWVSMPIVFRSYQMNVQENTMGVFTLASIYFILKGLAITRHSYLYIMLGAVFIFLATLCKGVTGLFPLVAVAMYGLSGGKIKFQKVIIFSLILVLVPALLYVLLLLNDNAFESYSFYYESRLLERIYNDPVVNTHFHILFRLLLDLLPVLVVTSVAALIQRKKVQLKKHPEEKSLMFFFILMGFAGSLPLAVTLVQRDFYLGPSLPFFALGLSLLLALFLRDVLKQFSQKVTAFRLFRVLSISLMIGGLIYTGLQIGKVERDHDILHDTHLFGAIIDEGSRVHLIGAAHDDTLKHWNLELYLARYYNISLGAPVEDTEYILLAEEAIQPAGELFGLVPLDTETYFLFRRID